MPIESRRRRLGAFSIACALVLSTTTASQAQTLVANASASRTNCAAPCAVFFDATGTTNNGRTATADPAVFKSLDYLWDFNDPDAGAWTYSGQPKSRDLGAVAGHVFERPGVFNVAVTVRTPDGTTSDTDTVTVTVSSADSQWPGSSTVCVDANSAPAAGTGGCPAGASTAIYTDFGAALETEINARGRTRILFARGDRFVTRSAISIRGNGPLLIGSYGQGAKPILDASGWSGGLFSVDTPDTRFVDLEIHQAPADASTELFGSFAAKLLALRIDAQHTAFVEGAEAQDYFQVECTLRNNNGGGIIRGKDPSRIAFLGNDFDTTSSAGEHFTRFAECRKCVWSHNRARNPKKAKHVLAIRACSLGGRGNICAGGETADSRFIMVRHNDIEGSNGSAAPIAFGCGSSTESCMSRHVIIESNRLRLAPDGQISLIDSGPAEQWVARNNLLLLEKGVTNVINIATAKNPSVPRNEGIEVYSNTLYNASSSAARLVDVEGSGAGEPIVRNNLAWSLNAPVAIVGGSGTWTADHNSAFTGANVNPFGQIPKLASPTTFQIAADSPVANRLVDAGSPLTTVPVRRDWSSQVRASGSAPDIGAWEVGDGGQAGSAPPPPVLFASP